MAGDAHASGLRLNEKCANPRQTQYESLQVTPVLNLRTTSNQCNRETGASGFPLRIRDEFSASRNIHILVPPNSRYPCRIFGKTG